MDGFSLGTKTLFPIEYSKCFYDHETGCLSEAPTSKFGHNDNNFCLFLISSIRLFVPIRKGVARLPQTCTWPNRTCISTRVPVNAQKQPFLSVSSASVRRMCCYLSKTCLVKGKLSYNPLSSPTKQQRVLSQHFQLTMHVCEVWPHHRTSSYTPQSPPLLRHPS